MSKDGYPFHISNIGDIAFRKGKVMEIQENVQENKRVEEGYSLDQIATAVLAIRDEIAKINKQAEKEVKKLASEKERLETYLNDKLAEVGADSVKTPAGTIIRQQKTRYWPADWEKMYEFIIDNDAFQLLEKRVHQTNMRKFLDEDPEKYPIGLNSEREWKITIRRS